MYRKYPIATDGIHHVMNKSIAGYEIYPRNNDYERMLLLIRYFSLCQQPAKFSYFLNRHPVVQLEGAEAAIIEEEGVVGRTLDIIAYCFMPTHFHLMVRQLVDGGVVDFMRKVQNAYARYFNTKYERKGRLWMGPFKNVPVVSDEQALHLTRYIHLNPTSAALVRQPENWVYSSYQEYIGRSEVKYPFTHSSGLFDISEEEYRVFCEDHVGYQRDLAIIKQQVLE